jgi:hypothetical protein
MDKKWKSPQQSEESEIIDLLDGVPPSRATVPTLSVPPVAEIMSRAAVPSTRASEN